MIVRPWTNHDDRTFLQMARGGFNSAQIAAQLGRSLRSIEWRLQHKGIKLRAHRPRAKPKRQQTVIVPPDQVLLTKAEVISHYELGWRFVDFDGDLLVFEWGGKGDARYPVEEMRRAA